MHASIDLLRGFMQPRGAVFAALMLAAAAPAAAQPLVGPILQIGAFYSQTVNMTDDCNNTRTCSYEFTKVPEGEEILIQHVTCGVHVLLQQMQSVYLFSRRGKNTIFNVHHFSWFKNTEHPIAYSVNTPVLAPIKQRRIPVIHWESLNSSNEFNGECTISGRMFDAP